MENEHIILSENGKCQTCNIYPDYELKLISSTDPVFKEFPNPHYQWEERHICNRCKIEFLIRNGT